MNPTADYPSMIPSGDHWMEAFSAGYFAMQSEADKTDEVDQAKAFEMYIGYTNHYRTQPFIALEAEADRSFPIPNSDYVAVGKLDTLVTIAGDPRKPLIQLEHKTGSRAADGEPFPFATSAVNSQITNYALCQAYAGQPLDYSIIDYVHVPQLRPKLIPLGTTKKTTGTRLEIENHQTYFHSPLSSPAKQLAKKGELTKENIELFRYRLRYLIDKEPTKYFARKSPIIRSEQDLIDQRQKLEQLTRDIDRAAEEEDLGAYYQNTNYCMSFNSKCEFMSLCDGTDTEDSGEWEPRRGSTGSGKKNLSYSKASCFMGCRRKFYYRYVKGLQKSGRDAKSLGIGNLFHVGLEHYYGKLIELA